MDIRKRDVVNLMVGITVVEKLNEKYDQHFTYALSKNRRLIRDEVEALQETEKKTLEVYNKEVDKLNEKYALRDDKKKVVMNQSGITIDPAGVYDYNKALDELNIKHKKILDENKAFFKEMVKVEIYKVENKYFPIMNGQIADYLFPMRKDPADEIEPVVEKKENNKK